MQPKNDFPAIATPPFGPTSYGLTVFQDDTVLTATQLNEWFSFVTAQEQATRTRLLGVGVATGLRPGLAADGSAITLSAGCGLTSEGHLLRLETAQAYAGFVPYAAPAPEVYPALAGLSLLELRPTAQGGQPLANLNLAQSLDQYAVVVFQNSGLLPAEHCMGLDCNDKGDTYDTRLQVLLVKQGDAIARLLKPGPVQAAAAYAKLPVLALRRPLLTDPTYPGRSQALKDFLQQAAAAFSDALARAAALVQSIDGFKQKSTDFYSVYADFSLAQAAGTGPELLAGDDEPLRFRAQPSRIRTSGRLTYVDQWRQQLISRVATLSVDANAQYVYDWLKDLYDAYEEFRQATAAPAWLGAAMPAADAFPRHLVLGELVPDGPLQAPQYRHAWQPAPSSSLSAADAPARGLWLFQRLGSLITQFSVPPLLSSGGSSGGVSVLQQLQLQDRLRNDELDQRAANEAAEAEAAAAEAAYGSEAGMQQSFAGPESLFFPAPTERIQPYKPLYEFPAEPAVVPQPGVPALRLVPDRARPASFDARSLPFYYTPAMRAAWSYARTASSQAPLILSYNAATDALDHVKQPLEYQLEGYDFFRVEGLLDAPAAAVLARLLSLRQQYNLPFDVVAVCADAPSTSQPLLTPVNTQGMADQEVEFNDLMLQLQDDGAPALNVRIQLSTSAFNAIAGPYKDANPTLAPRVDLLVALNAAYQVRLAALNAQLSFAPFLKANPGLEHGAGVPRGGTLVIVYRTLPSLLTNASNNPPLVVGDYYLPYRLGGNGPVVQFTLPASPPAVAIEQNPVNVLDNTVRLSVSPAGGTFDRLVKMAVDGTYYFNPTSLVGTVGDNGYSTQKLTYTVDNKSTELNVVVFGPPRVASFTGAVDAEGVATFSYQVFNATQLLVDFGDGTSETFVLPVTPSQNGTGDYRSRFATSDDASLHTFRHKYATIQNRYPTLTATHGNQKVMRGATLTFDHVAVTLANSTKDNVVLQGAAGLLIGSPVGGLFSSRTLADAAGKLLSSSSGAYVAAAAGPHEVSYAYGLKQSASITLFAVPNDFSTETFRYDGKEISGLVTLPTLPTGMYYRWYFGGLLGDQEAILLPAEDGKTTATYKFSIKGVEESDLKQVPLTLVVYDERQRVLLAESGAEVEAPASLLMSDQDRGVAATRQDGVFWTVKHLLFVDSKGNPTR